MQGVDGDLGKLLADTLNLVLPAEAMSLAEEIAWFEEHACSQVVTNFFAKNWETSFVALCNAFPPTTTITTITRICRWPEPELTR